MLVRLRRDLLGLKSPQPKAATARHKTGAKRPALAHDHAAATKSERRSSNQRLSSNASPGARAQNSRSG
jgi:hypothetical protein